jgi:hypothetical protein
VLSRPYHVGSADAETVTDAGGALSGTVGGYDDPYGLAPSRSPQGARLPPGSSNGHRKRGTTAGPSRRTRRGSTRSPSRFRGHRPDRPPLLVHPGLHDSLGGGVLDDRWRLNAIFGREVAPAESISTVVHGRGPRPVPRPEPRLHYDGGTSRRCSAASRGRSPGHAGRAVTT